MPVVKKDSFNTLFTINANEHVEKKNGLSYLSWAWAWGIAKQNYPDSYYTIYEATNGWNYFTDGKTCWVKTGVTIVDGEKSLELIEYLPIMDFRNKSIPLDSVTSMDVNKAIQRSLTKALARHGLGLYIYAGEDLPEESEEDKAAKREEAERINELIKQIDGIVMKIVKPMDKQAREEYCDEVIVPIIGQKNYKNCREEKKLSALLDKLKAA